MRKTSKTVSANFAFPPCMLYIYSKIMDIRLFKNALAYLSLSQETPAFWETLIYTVEIDLLKELTNNYCRSK